MLLLFFQNSFYFSHHNSTVFETLNKISFGNKFVITIGSFDLAPTNLIFELVRAIVDANILTKFRENRIIFSRVMAVTSTIAQ